MNLQSLHSNSFVESHKKVITEFKEFIWTIDNFRRPVEYYPARYAYPEIQSPSFVVNGLSFYFRLYPLGSKEDIVNDVSIILYFECALFFQDNPGRDAVKVRCKIGAINSTGKRCLIEDRFKTFKKNTSKTKRNKRDDRYVLASREHLLNPANNYLCDNHLKIFCELEIVDDQLNPSQVAPMQVAPIQVAPIQTQPKRDKPYESQNGQNIWQSGTVSDSEIVVGTTKFKVHKAILTAQSAKLANIAEKGHEQVIDSLQADVFEQVLRFIYSGQVHSLEFEQMADKLLLAAHEFDLHQLKTKCEECLCGKLVLLSNENDNAVESFYLNVSKVMSGHTLKQIKDKPELFIGLMSRFTKMYKN